MIYYKNLPVWDRLVRFGAALAMISCGVHFSCKAAGWAFLIVGAVALMTAVVGFCPGCAIAGRRLAARARQAP